MFQCYCMASRNNMDALSEMYSKLISFKISLAHNIHFRRGIFLKFGTEHNSMIFVKTPSLKWNNCPCIMWPYSRSSAAIFVCIPIMDQVVIWMLKYLSNDKKKFITKVKSCSQVYISNVLKVSSIRALCEISEGFGSYEISYEQFCETPVQYWFLCCCLYFSVPVPWPYFRVPLPRPTWHTGVSLCHFRW